MTQLQTSQASLDARSAGEAAILEAAVNLFSEFGYDRVSMRQIAQAARVSKANIYHHFDSKEQLYLSILKDSTERFSLLLDRLAADEGSFEDRLRSFAKAHLENVFENAGTVRLVLREILSGDEESNRTRVAPVMSDIFHRLVDILRSGQRSGALKSDLDPGLCALMLMGGDLFYFQCHQVLKHIPDSTRSERVLESLYDFESSVYATVDEAMDLEVERKIRLNDRQATREEIEEMYERSNRIRYQTARDFAQLREQVILHTSKKEWKAINKELKSFLKN